MISEELNYWIGLTDFADGIITMLTILSTKANFHLIDGGITMQS